MDKVEALGILTPPGRLVQGNPFERQSKDSAGNERENPVFFVALAVEKTHPDIGSILQEIYEYAQSAWPRGQATWPQNPASPTFSWKIVDGDDPHFSNKEGFENCWVFRLSSGYNINVCKDGGRTTLTDPSQFPWGDFGRAYFTIKSNGNSLRPGLYFNIHILEWLSCGPRITSGPDAVDILSKDVIGLPASATIMPHTPSQQVPPAQQVNPFTQQVPPAQQVNPSTQQVPPAQQVNPSTQQVPPAQQINPFTQQVPPAQQINPFTQQVPPAQQVNPSTQQVPPAQQVNPSTQQVQPDYQIFTPQTDPQK